MYILSREEIVTVTQLHVTKIDFQDGLAPKSNFHIYIQTYNYLLFVY